MALSESDKNMIVYFITEKGDITRWCDYEKKKEDIKQAYPLLVRTLDKIKNQEALLRVLVNEIEESII